MYAKWFSSRLAGGQARYVWPAIGLLLTVAVTWLFAHEGHAPLPSRGAQVDLEKGQIILSKDARDALNVQSTEISNRPVPEKILAYATLVAPWQQHAFVTTRLPGRIVKLNVKPGQSVEAGETMAEIQSVDLEALQLELLNAQNDYRLAEKILQGFKEGSGAFPEREILEAQTKKQQLHNALKISKYKWLSLGLGPETLDGLLKEGKRVLALPVRSPIRGTVIHADLTVGRVVEPTEHLFEVVDLAKVWVKIDVLEKDLNRVAVGQTVELRLTGFVDEVFQTKVQVKGYYLDPVTHMNTVWGELVNSPSQEPRLLPGMTGQAQILMPGSTVAKTIPAIALINDGVDRFVLVEESKSKDASQYQKKSVVVVRETPEWVEIQAGDLFPGDRVVTQGAAQLAEFFRPGVLRISSATKATIGLRVEAAQSRVVEDVILLQGAVDVPPDQRSFAAVQMAGALEKILIDRGEEVQAGQVVAEIASLDFINLQLELLKEHLDFQFLEEQVKRLQGSESAFPRRRLLELESSMNSSRNRRDSLSQRLEVLGLAPAQLKELLDQKKLARTLPVRAPISGTVVHFDKVLGQAMKVQESLVEIHNLSNPWIQGYVTEKDFARVRGLLLETAKRPAAARVQLVNDAGAMVPGKVVRSGRIFPVENSVLSVWVELDQFPKQPLRHGQLAQLSLIVNQPPPTLAVPLAAVIREGTQAFVFVQNADGTFDRRAVTTGRADDRLVEITRGLEGGELIAVTAAAELQTAFASLR